jgi:hypothetical protein
MRNKQIYLRAIAIVQRANGTPEERAKIRASFALLFWNDPGFKPSEFNAACDAAIAVFPGPREN